MMTINELQGKRVRVYYNLHRKCLSVQYRGKVVAHVKHITLDNVLFNVSQSGRMKVISSGQKNVHAFVVGYVCAESMVGAPYCEVTYNPRIHTQFVNAITHKEVYGALHVLIDGKQIYAYGVANNA